MCAHDMAHTAWVGDVLKGGTWRVESQKSMRWISTYLRNWVGGSGHLRVAIKHFIPLARYDNSLKGHMSFSL